MRTIDILKERITAKLEQLGISARKASIEATGQPSAILNILSKDAMPSVDRLHDIAERLGTTADWLLGRTDVDGDAVRPIGKPDVTPEQAAEVLDLVPVASVDMDYGMGGAFTADHVDVEMRYFPRQWLEAVTHTAPASLAWARGRGNSMSPTIDDGDLLLIDRSDNRVQDQDAIWAFTIGDIAMTKRLRVRGEKVTILSDNDRVPDDVAHPDEINIVGRVSHVVKRV